MAAESQCVEWCACGLTGASFSSLNAAWEQAEIAAEKLSAWEQLMAWAIYGGLHREARFALQKQIAAIEVANVDCAFVEKKFSENLFSTSEPGYPAEMKAAYQNDMRP